MLCILDSRIKNVDSIFNKSKTVISVTIKLQFFSTAKTLQPSFWTKISKP